MMRGALTVSATSPGCPSDGAGSTFVISVVSMRSPLSLIPVPQEDRGEVDDEDHRQDNQRDRQTAREQALPADAPGPRDGSEQPYEYGEPEDAVDDRRDAGEVADVRVDESRERRVPRVFLHVDRRADAQRH